jgi:DnaJ like chaperone protein
LNGWLGKLGGSLLGFMAGGYVGAFVGALLGHQFDRGIAGQRLRDAGGGMSDQDRRRVFFETTFLIMGRLAKADGRVSEEEIQAARAVMHRMHLTPEAVRQAISLFTRGKQGGLDVDEQLRALRRACGHQPDLVRAFLEIQLELGLSKGAIKPSERELLWRIATGLGVGRVELAQLEAELHAQRSFRGRASRTGGEYELDQAYKALGVQASATDREVKLAYRRLMNQHHPDKLAARGLPDAMLEVAKERTSEIGKAYDVIKARRGLK